MAETNVVSQLKIKTGADSYETYDLKDNHMIFRDIYYRGRPAGYQGDENAVYGIDVFSSTQGDPTYDANREHGAGRIWKQINNVDLDIDPNSSAWNNLNENTKKEKLQTVLTADFEAFNTHNDWKNYYSNNVYIGTKFIQAEMGFPISNYGPYNITIRISDSYINNPAKWNLLTRCVQLYLEQGTNTRFCDKAYLDVLDGYGFPSPTGTSSNSSG